MTDQSALRRQPALDGIRAVAVVLVLLFHAGFGWMSGGYLGVSVFFTLSGYLITNLLLDEHDRSGRIVYSRFYSRRLRRLLPASAACLMGIVVLRALGEFRFVGGLRTDLLGAALQVSNWVQLAGSSSYSKLFDSSSAFASPVAHFWSLAIEEQFYLVWPVALLVIVRASRGRPRRLVVALGALTISFAALAPLIAVVWGADAAYWATPARLGELLVGALLAAALRADMLGPATITPPWSTVLTGGCLGCIVALSVVLPSDGGPAFSGWLTPFALLSAGLIVGLQGAGPIRDVLSTRLLVWIGGLSYAVYLFHWPVYLVMREHGWSLTDPVGFTLALGITFALAWLSGRFLEQPIRSASWDPPRVFAGAAVSAFVVVALVSAVPMARGFLQVDRAQLAAAAIQPTGSLVPLRPQRGAGPDDRVVVPPAGTTASSSVPGDEAVPLPSDTIAPPATEPMDPDAAAVASAVLDIPELPQVSRPVRVVVVGDSTALYVGSGLAAWAVAHPDVMQVEIVWSQGFGFLTSGTITSWDAQQYVDRSGQLLAKEIPGTLDRVQADVVVYMVTVDDILDRRWSEAEGVLRPTAPAYAQRLEAAYDGSIGLALDHGAASVVWLIPPVTGSWSTGTELRQRDRQDAQADVIRRVAAGHGATSVVDLDAWFEASGKASDRSVRPDGVHLTEVSGAMLADEFLGPTLVRLAVDGAP